MSDFPQQRARNLAAGAESWLAKPLAPEEVRVGDFVGILQVTYEFPSFFWCADPILLPHHELVRLQFIPENGGMPLKVRSICLPFVWVKNPAGEQRTIDLRKYRLARLHSRYAKMAWKAGKKAQSKTPTV